MKDHEPSAQFETRKADHIRVAMDPKVQSLSHGLDQFAFVHEALPELDFDDVSISSEIFATTKFAKKQESPFFISSMTAGHAGSHVLNEKLACAAELKGWAMGVGSQRRQLSDASAASEWARIRVRCPSVSLFGNIGLSQLIQTSVDDIKRLVDSLDAMAMIVHLNPLQEVLQVEGTPRFRGGLNAIERLVRDLGCPVVVKETGCGISGVTAQRLLEIGVHAIDVSGRGGTHWGRIEGLRAEEGITTSRSKMLAMASATLSDWGLSTADSITQVAQVLESGRAQKPVATELWASGGIRSGLDGAKALALGANAVGIAQPLMAAALLGEEDLQAAMERFDYELKAVLFCVGARDLTEFKSRGTLVRQESDGTT